MKHLKKGRKFKRTASVRKLLLRNLVNSLIVHGKLESTEAKVKEVRPIVERYITRAKEENLTNRRYLLANLNTRSVNTLFKVAREKYSKRNGG